MCDSVTPIRRRRVHVIKKGNAERIDPDVLALTSDGNGNVVKSNGPYSTLVGDHFS